MSAAATPHELERFRSALVEQIGLQFEDAKGAFLGEVLHRRTARRACSTASYLAKLEDGPPAAEIAALAEELTVSETYFFRHNDQFRALAEVVLPERMRARAGDRTLRLLSAGCASGEEAYSLAIVAHETVVDPAWNVVIRALDLNPGVLRKAEKAHYSAWALRESSPEIKQKWFRCDGRDLILDDKVRGAVRFEQGNLASDDPALWQPALYDVIFCRNVLMYFAPAQMRAAITRMAASLAPSGYLFLGHAETLRGISDDFQLCHTHETFYYRRKDRLRSVNASHDAVKTSRTPAVSPALAPVMQTTAWIDAIQRASDRVALLVPANGNGPPPQAAPAWRLAPALDLLRHERFGEALDHVSTGPPETKGDPDVLLVKAVLLAQNGQSAAAEETCQQLLLIDGLNSGAHYVLALCREHAGERRRAMEHDRAAVHLDPTFAMPRLHCGLLARWAGDRDGRPPRPDAGVAPA